MNQRTYQGINVDTALELFKRPNLLLLDCRTHADFTQECLPGAQHLTERNAGDFIQIEPKNRPVLIYCYHGNASQIHAQMFIDFGFSEVYSLEGGLLAWHFAALPENHFLSTSLQNWLINQGFSSSDIHSPLTNGMTPLMRAAREANPDRVLELLAAGASPHPCNGDGNQALWLACVGENLSILDTLMAVGCDINHQNDNGATCLMYAVSTGKAAVAERLLRLGANPNLATLDDFTAIDMAATVDCLNLLRRAVDGAS
ncbi:MAG: ankyrin repeat domain-containing protein [Halothiobacillus sp.]